MTDSKSQAVLSLLKTYLNDEKNNSLSRIRKIGDCCYRALDV